MVNSLPFDATDGSVALQIRGIQVIRNKPRVPDGPADFTGSSSFDPQSGARTHEKIQMSPQRSWSKPSTWFGKKPQGPLVITELGPDGKRVPVTFHPASIDKDISDVSKQVAFKDRSGQNIPAFDKYIATQQTKYKAPPWYNLNGGVERKTETTYWKPLDNINT